MAKKGKVKKTLVDQILDKAKIDHDSLSFNGLEGELPEDVARESIYKTLALKGDKTGPVIGIIPITEHLSEKLSLIHIDQSAQEAGFLIVSAGEIGRSIRINSQELADFVNAEFADIKE